MRSRARVLFGQAGFCQNRPTHFASARAIGYITEELNMSVWTKKMWMSDRRSSPRYRVDSLRDLQGYLHFGKHLRKRLCTFGHGGCGFYVDFEPDQSGLLD